MEDHTQAINLDPDNAKLSGARSSDYVGLRRYEDAIEDLDQSIRIDPDSAMAYNNRGNTYGRLGQYQQAVEDHSEAIRIEPTALRYNNRRTDYKSLDQLELALEDYNAAVRLDLKYAPAYANRARAYTLLGLDNEAALDVATAIELGYDRSRLEGDIEELKGQR